MRILNFTTLFPNRAMPSHGVFVENRLRHLVQEEGIEARVVAPSPWFPFADRRFGRYATFANVPGRETRYGLQISHPRYLMLPRLGMNLAPFTIFAGAVREVARLRSNGFEFDLIDAHYFYPDGVAAVLLAKYFRKPVCITARGSDLSEYPLFPVPRRLIRWAARNCDGVITVARALMEELERLVPDLPQPPAMRRTLRNGVDLEMFRPMDRASARQQFSITRPTLLSVGHLIPRKANEIVVRAMPLLTDYDLVIAGSGPDRSMLLELVDQLGLRERVRLIGQVPHSELAKLYNAADALILASSREGWANVLLEAMACGTPVVASNVWGTPEVVAAREAGRLMAARKPDELAAAVRELFSDYPDRLATRRYAENFSWRETSRGQREMFELALKRHSGPR